MTPYTEAMARHRERRHEVVLRLIMEAAQAAGPDVLGVIASLARAGLAQETSPEAARMVDEAMVTLPAEPYGRPADGIGHLAVTVSYEPVDRDSVLESSHFFRVRKGPILPQRQILRERTLQTLEGVLERIESMEAAGHSDSPPT